MPGDPSILKSETRNEDDCGDPLEIYIRSLPLEASSHDHIGSGADEHAHCSFRLQRG